MPFPISSLSPLGGDEVFMPFLKGRFDAWSLQVGMHTSSIPGTAFWRAIEGVGRRRGRKLGGGDQREGGG